MFSIFFATESDTPPKRFFMIMHIRPIPGTLVQKDEMFCPLSLLFLFSSRISSFSLLKSVRLLSHLFGGIFKSMYNKSKVFLSVTVVFELRTVHNTYL